MMKETIINEDGISLVEILVSVAIFSIGLLALAQIQISAIQGNAFSGTTTDATTLAQDRMEQLMALTYTIATTDANLVDTDADGDGGLQDATAGTADFNQAAGPYTVFWNISDGSVIGNTKKINVIVAWADGWRQRTVRIEGVKARRS